MSILLDRVNNPNCIVVFKFLDCNYDEDGNVKSVKQLVHNFEVVMDKDSRFAGKIRLNEFAQQPYLYGSVPWENENNCRAWSSHDDSALFSLIQADYGLKSRQDFADALKNVSMRNKFHPVTPAFMGFSTITTKTTFYKKKYIKDNNMGYKSI